jgi:hypothetical protein
MANLYSSPYSKYLKLLGSWPTNLGLASQWYIWFDFTFVNCLKDSLQQQLNYRESFLGNNGWKNTNNVRKKLLDGELQYDSENLAGCVFARQVGLPSEAITAGNEGLTYGGYMAPATAGSREKYKKLTVTFLETNASFLDLIIRPWIVMVGYNGLVARSNSSPKRVKANYADVVMLAKTGSGFRMEPRKVFRFYNLAPVSIDGEEYSYMTEGMKYSNVSFVYDGYSVSDANTPNLIGLKNSVINNLGLGG